MRLLLDTHTLIWWDSDPDQLPERVLEALRDPANTVWISVVSVGEIIIKAQFGKLSMRLPLADIIHRGDRRQELSLERRPSRPTTSGGEQARGGAIART